MMHGAPPPREGLTKSPRVLRRCYAVVLPPSVRLSVGTGRGFDPYMAALPTVASSTLRRGPGRSFPRPQPPGPTNWGRSSSF